MESTEDKNDAGVCVHFLPRKAACENGAINAHKDIWEAANIRKFDFSSVNVFPPWSEDLSVLVNKVNKVASLHESIFVILI